jgi:iron complex outermembrane receptor protein
MAKRTKLWKASVLGSVGSALAIGYSLSAQEPAAPARPSILPNFFGNLFLTAQQPSPVPSQPPVTGQGPKEAPKQGPAPVPTPEQPSATPPAAGSLAESFLNVYRSSFTAPAASSESAGTPAGAGAQGVVSTSQQQTLASTPSTGVVSGAESTTRNTTDTGDLLGKSFGSVGVEIQRRNPIVSDPHIRGYHLGQVVTTADGAFWTPARSDLDTIVSKLDSANIANILVLKGPYSVRQGPGFSFLDVETLSSPRYKTYETHGSTSMTYKTNGEAMNGRQAVWGGSTDYGFRVSYDIMSANDYHTGGNRLTLPTSYNSQDFNFNLGLDLTEDSRIEMRALHLSQRNIEFPGIVTDLTKAVTDGYTMRYSADNQEWFDRLTIDAWYNNTRFTGDSLNAGKARQIPNLDNFALGLPPGFQAKYSVETDGENHTWGFREAMTWGKAQDLQVTAGVDFAYQSSAINEFDTFVITTQNFPVPRSYSTDPGFFTDTFLPVGDRLSFKVGGRVDFNESRIQSPPTFPSLLAPGFSQTDFLTSILGPNALNAQSFLLWSAYGTSELKITNELTASLGYGTAQRPPTLTEMFAAGTFLGILQPGLTYTNGNPDLNQETLHQVDFGVKGNYENVRAGGNVYYARVFDYITYQRISSIGIFTGYKYINTPQAALIGGEGFGEVDLTEWLTPFATFYYTYGQDLSRNEALPNIFPMDVRVGVRIHEASRQPRWGTELNVRMVQGQHRVAATLGDPATLGTNELPTAGFTVVDIRGYYAITKNVLATAGIENLGDRFYREHLDYRSGLGVFQPGLNGYMGLRVNY